MSAAANQGPFYNMDPWQSAEMSVLFSEPAAPQAEGPSILVFSG